MADDFDARITFHDDLQCMEADFSGFDFASSAVVNAFYDRIEDRIRETGETLWFFLVNYSGCKIDTSAWVAFSRRGKALNLAHSMGSVRFDASDETRRQIERDAETERFDPNLFADRDLAIARIRALPSKRRVTRVEEVGISAGEIARRITFDATGNAGGPLMTADFSRLTFAHSGDVDAVYDHIEDAIRASDRKWYFLVNMDGCEVHPAAWVRYAFRGKRLNQAASLGTVRFAPGSETASDIRLRAESQGFDPNIRNTREEAMTRLAEIRRDLLAEAQLEVGG
ncbi:hypothetical protein [Rhodalgimonas zhirmunskyi]|uniref:Uncharacterized protein n=1 Tax=Rhodalgimonas zhirmunskyi TaxID=2964767 RepID=A0AAJ1UF36_9RHOB|nr:hypothetical protein [Rhodoalgimonas zhirmunskyi]MDQ2095096.1 hypothetical protein [Rhodoalgimonas zhirmunskyi]